MEGGDLELRIYRDDPFLDFVIHLQHSNFAIATLKVQSQLNRISIETMATYVSIEGPV